jgi:radical SAM-linked protein
VHGCQKCGVCDFKEILPRVHHPSDVAARHHTADPVGESAKQVDSKEPSFLYRISYSRRGDVRFLGHLELIQVFFRALSRAKAELKFSQGFNPTPKVSFSPALPVGTESLAEYLDVEFLKPLSDPQAFLARFNLQLPAGLQAENISLHIDRDGPVMLFCYEIILPRPFTEDEKESITLFSGWRSFVISRLRKGGQREYDVRPQVKEFKKVGDAKVQLSLLHESGKATPKPLELLRAVLGISEEEALRARVIKIRREDFS